MCSQLLGLCVFHILSLFLYCDLTFWRNKRTPTQSPLEGAFRKCIDVTCSTMAAGFISSKTVSLLVDNAGFIIKPEHL